MMQRNGASPTLPDRETALSQFRNLREAARLLPGLTYITQEEEYPKESVAPLASLRPILLKEMTLGRKQIGRVPHGTLIEMPCKQAAIVTILEDSAGDVIPLLICNAAVNSSSAAVEAQFPRGMRIAVNEPYFKVSKTGRVAVRVDNPVDIIDWNTVVAREVETSAVPDSSMEAVESLREEGKRCMSQKQWDKAIVAYSRCLDVLEAKSSSQEVVEQCATAYSNRAEAWLRLDHHINNAFSDAVKSLERDGNNIKSTVRKVTALCGLQCHQEAIACLQDTLKREPHLRLQTRTDLVRRLRGAETSKKQSRSGMYDLNDFYRSGGQKAAPMCDFVGPAEVRKVRSSNSAVGRGLFATRNVKAGDLLLASHALAVADTDPNGYGVFFRGEGAGKTLFTNCTEDLIAKLVDISRRNPFRRKQLFALSDSTPASVSDVPPMTLFTPPANSREALSTYTSVEQENATEVDVTRVPRIVSVNASKASKSVEGLDLAGATGLWVLPSLINHSCVPNAAGSVIKNVMFMRATRDIRNGEEITQLYFPGHQTFPERTSVCAQYNFVCRCPRCSFERSFAETVPEISRLAEDSARLLAGNSNLPPAQVTAAGTKIAMSVEKILEQVPAHDAHKRDWIRASFRRAYMCHASQLMLVAMQTCDWKPWAQAMDSIFDMMLSVVPDEEFLVRIANAVQYSPVSKKQRAKWIQLGKSICTLMFGPLEEATLNVIGGHYLQKPVFPPMHSITSGSGHGGDV